PGPSLFPYTTLFRSHSAGLHAVVAVKDDGFAAVRLKPVEPLRDGAGGNVDRARQVRLVEFGIAADVDEQGVFAVVQLGGSRGFNAAGAPPQPEDLGDDDRNRDNSRGEHQQRVIADKFDDSIHTCAVLMFTDGAARLKASRQSPGGARRREYVAHDTNKIQDAPVLYPIVDTVRILAGGDNAFLAQNGKMLRDVAL